MSMSKVGRTYSLILLLSVLSLSLICSISPLWAAVGNLETPTPGSFQSGVGLIRGWVCSANRVDIEIVGRGSLQAVYGEPRGDTQGACGDTNNGFSLQFNWNDLGEGTHTVRAVADGVEVGRAQVVVATLGQTFLQGAQGEFTVSPFPQDGQQTRIRWQESRQAFVLTTGGTPASGGGNPRADAKLEDPTSGTFQSGIGPIRGWVCNASRVELALDGGAPVPAVYGQPRGDTQGACSDINNGFSLQVNWNEVGDGTHTIRVLADGAEVGTATFTVVTLGLGSFPEGLVGDFVLSEFPKTAIQTEVRWQESQQNFVVTGALYPGISEGLCTTQQGEVQDREGGRATIRWSNPCLLSGNLAVQHYQVPARSALVSPLVAPAAVSGGREPRAATEGSFFLCESSLAIRQGDQVFTGEDFRLVDLAGTEVCRELPPGTSLDVLLQVEATSDLNFNTPFVAAYENRDVVTFVADPPPPGGTPTLTLSTEEIDFTATPLAILSPRGITSSTSGAGEERESRVQSGEGQERTFTLTNSGTGVLKGGLTLIAAGSGSNVFTLVSDDTFRIEPGQSQTVTVRYTAVDNTPMTGSLRISTNGGVKSVVLRGGGSGGGQLPPPQPQLTVQPPSLDFGQVQLGQTVDRSLTVTNTGGDTLTGNVSTNAPFSIVGNGSFSLTANQSQTVILRFTPTGSQTVSGSATVSSNGSTVTVPLTGQGAPCTFTLSATSAQVAAAGGPGTVNVTAVEGCGWTAVSNDPWITVTSGGSGSGNGTVNYTVEANPEASMRTGTLAIAGQTVTVTQTGASCTYTITPTSLSADAGGGTGTVTVTTLASGCSWTAVSHDPWITITSGSSGSGNGTVSYTVATNTSTTSRTGTLTIAGQTFTVTQAGVGCSYTISPTVNPSVRAAGDTGSVSVSTTPTTGCSWTAVSNVPWITITSGSNGSGTGTVGYTVAANPNTSERTGTLTITGQTFTVTQAGASCSYTISPTANPAVPATGGTGNVNVSTTPASGCSWTAVSNVPWITITGGSSGSGNGTVSYITAVNTDTTRRTGTLTIAGQTLTVTQLVGPIIGVQFGGLDFGSVPVGSFVDMTYFITNLGGGILTGSAIANSGPPFSVVSGSTFALNNGEGLGIVVRFNPTQLGLVQGGLEIVSNALNAGDIIHPLSGTGVNPPRISFSPTVLDFGFVNCRSEDRTFTITNSGGGTLVGTVSLTSSSFSGYSIVSGTSYNLSAGQGPQSFTVRLTGRFGGPSAYPANGTVDLGVPGASIELRAVGADCFS